MMRDGGSPLSCVALSGEGAIAFQSSGGTLELIEPLHPTAEGRRAALRFQPPAGAKPRTRFLVSVTETRTSVTGFVEVVVP